MNLEPRTPSAPWVWYYDCLTACCDCDPLVVASSRLWPAGHPLHTVWWPAVTFLQRGPSLQSTVTRWSSPFTPSPAVVLAASRQEPSVCCAVNPATTATPMTQISHSVTVMGAGTRSPHPVRVSTGTDTVQCDSHGRWDTLATPCQGEYRDRHRAVWQSWALGHARHTLSGWVQGNHPVRVNKERTITLTGVESG